VTTGQAYNIGGGSGNTISVWAEFGTVLGNLLGREVPVTYGAWRAGDQRAYVSDISKAKQDLGWQPSVQRADGIRRLYEWVVEHEGLF